MEADDRRGMERLGFTSLPAPADNTTLALPPFGKQPGFKPGLIEHRRAVSPIRTDKLSSASPSDRLSGWRLAEGAADAACQAAYRLRPKALRALRQAARHVICSLWSGEGNKMKKTEPSFRELPMKERI